MPTTKKAIKSKQVPASQAPPKRPAQPSAIPRPIQTAKPSTSNARTTRIPSGTKRVHPSSARSQQQNGAEASDDDSASNPHARKVPRTSPPRDTGSASAASSARSPRPNGAGLYSTGRRLPTPMMAAMHSAQSTEAPTSQNHFASPARSARSRESSVKTEDAGEADQEDPVYMDVGGELAASGYGSANDDQDLDDEEFNPWIEEFTVPTQRGSPSPELRYQRSFTKLGQRKPTPRRILLPDEGDLSAMAKTVYYEHDEDQVEAPSPSPNSRRRAIRARERALETAILSPAQPVRFLDGLDAPEDDDDDEEEEINPNASGNRNGENLRDPVDAEASGYGYDPRGFQVLEEVTPDASMEDMDVSSSSSSLSQASTSAQLTQSSRTKTRVLATEPKEQPARHATPPPPPEDPSFDDDDGLLDDPADDSRVPIASGSNGVRRPSGPQLVIVAATPQKTRQPSEPMSQHSPTPHEGTLHPHADVSASFETTEEEEDEEEDDESLDPDVVTVKSGNPKAAAKAAAILRLHHSYIIDEDIGNRSQTGRAPSRQGHSARRPSRSRSRARSEHAGDITMPDLVDEFEVELSQNLPRHPRAPSPSKRKLSGSRLSIPERLQNDGRISPTGSIASSTGAGPSSNRSVSSSESDPWTKEDWKNLERCFIQERKVVAQRMQLTSSRDVDPKHVDVDLVVERFKGFLVASKQMRFGPDWDRRKLVTRATVLARGISKKSQGAGDMTAAIRGESRDAATPSTFGDEFDYDQSLSMSRQGSVIGSSAGTGLYPQVNPPTANHASNGKTRTVSASSSETGPATQESGASHANSTKNTVASRLLGYLSGGRASPTPPPGSDDSFKRPMPRAPSSLRSVADSSGSTPSPTGPDMVQIRRDGRTPLVEPLRRASTGPMKDPDVRVMREREARPSLRHREPPTVLDSSPARSISIPPLNHVDAIDYVRSSYSPAAPRALRSVSSASSVRDLVRGFEDLSQEGIQNERAGTPRSVGRDEAASPRPRWSGGSSGSDHKPTLGDESIESTSSADSPYLFSETSFASSNVREIVVPKRKAIPETAAPHKKRMSFLGQWAS